MHACMVSGTCQLRTVLSTKMETDRCFEKLSSTKINARLLYTILYLELNFSQSYVVTLALHLVVNLPLTDHASARVVLGLYPRDHCGKCLLVVAMHWFDVS